jgi:hypothetical protein
LQSDFPEVILPALLSSQQFGIVLLEIRIEDDVWESQDVDNLLTNFIDLVLIFRLDRMLREEAKPLKRGLVDGFHEGISQLALVGPEPSLLEENPEYTVFDVCGDSFCL